MSAQDNSDSGRIEWVQEGHIGKVYLEHSGRMNAITVAMWRSLRTLFEDIASGKRGEIWCVVVRGRGGNFAAGADIQEFPEMRKNLETTVHYHEEILAPALRAVAECPCPVVAAIEGVCVGGGLEIASRCDIRIAAIGSRFGVPINQLGFPMAPFELESLVELVGPSAAMEVLLEGKIYAAGEAKAMGIVNRVVTGSMLEDEVEHTVKRILKGGPLAAKWNKKSLQRWKGIQREWSKEEKNAFYAGWAESEDHREGVDAFLKKQKPDFKGR